MPPAMASQVYGGAPMPQPTGTTIVTPENQLSARTTPAPAKAALVHNPTLWLVAILAVAVGLVSFTLKVGPLK